MKFLTAFITSTISWLFVAWYLMLGAGIVHLHWLHGVPTISYSTALPLALLLNFVLDGAALRAYYDHKLRAARS